MKRKSLLLGFVMVILFTNACGAGSGMSDSISQTLTPMSELVRETVTARAGEEGSNDSLATAIANATQKAEGIYATQTARAELNEPARLATATAIAPVVAELPRYGVDPASGYVAWIHPPATISLNGFNQTGYANDYPQVTAKDFVLAADITWNTKNSLSGCGFMFRSDGNTNNPSQYTIIITRVASGHMAFLAIAKGEVSNFREYFPKDKDRSFNWFNDSTNRLAIVVKGDLIDLYTNGVFIGQVNITEPPPDRVFQFPEVEIPPGTTPQQLEQYQQLIEQYDDGNRQIAAQLGDAQKNFTKNQPFFYDGLLGFLGLSQSGQMICTFDNAWLFITKP